MSGSASLTGTLISAAAGTLAGSLAPFFRWMPRPPPVGAPAGWPDLTAVSTAGAVSGAGAAGSGAGASGMGAGAAAAAAAAAASVAAMLASLGASLLIVNAQNRIKPASTMYPPKKMYD